MGGMPNSGTRLAGKIAVVTGGAHGIGRAYCLGYAAEGATVAVLDLDGVTARKVADEINGTGGAAMAEVVDIADESSVAGAVSRVVAEFGRIDILVNNAAMFSVVPMSRSSFEELTVDEWDRMMAINVRGTWLMCRQVAPHMKRLGSGKIINISSGSVFKGTKTQIHYVTSKAALYGFTHTLARELGPFGINVNNIAPGSTLSEEEPTDGVLAMRNSVVPTRALQRVEEPGDLVGTAIFLASSESDFMTGQTLVVDGGAVFL